jgi:putative intracellular protease/amidase
MANRPSPKKLRIGVMLEEVQFSDVVGMDIFGNLSKEYMNEVKQFDSNGLLTQFEDYAMDIEFLFLATTLEPVRVTPGLRFVPTVTYDDCPRDLDIVIIGGPLLSHRPAPADKFMKEAWTKTRVWMTTCIGSIWLASSGVLEGKTCTCNREFLEGAKKLYPGVNWLDQRWVVEDKPYDGEGKGELWTGGGAGAGKCLLQEEAFLGSNSAKLTSCLRPPHDHYLLPRKL